jgi:hypothetical protein
MSKAATRVLELFRRPSQGVTDVTHVTAPSIAHRNATVTPVTPITYRDEQSLNKAVTRLPAGASQVRSVALALGDSLPADISEGLSRLYTMSALPGFSQDRWMAALDATRQLSSTWAPRALSLGWKPEDLFGLHPRAPAARYDGMGLTFLLHPCDCVTLLTTDTAAIRSSGGAVLTFRRAFYPTEAVLAWLLTPDLN